MPLEELAYFQHTQSYSPRPPRSFPLFSAPNIKFLILLAVKKKIRNQQSLTPLSPHGRAHRFLWD